MKIDKNFYKNTSFKLGALSIIILVSLLTSSFMFNSQIEKLKKRIDYIYFGNYIPVLKLHTIEDQLNSLIVCMRTHKKCEREPYFNKIKEEWNYYNNSFKNDEERVAKMVFFKNRHKYWVVNSFNTSDSILTLK